MSSNTAKSSAQQTKRIESDSLRARQKTLASFIEARLLAILAKSDGYCSDGFIVTYDGDMIRVMYRPPRGWRYHMKGERYCPPTKADRADKSRSTRRGVLPRFDYDRHYLYND